MTAWGVSRLEDLLSYDSTPAPSSAGAGWWDDDNLDSEGSDHSSPAPAYDPSRYMAMTVDSLDQHCVPESPELDYTDYSSPSLGPSPGSSVESPGSAVRLSMSGEDPEANLVDLVAAMEESESPTTWLAAAERVRVCQVLDHTHNKPASLSSGVWWQEQTRLQHEVHITAALAGATTPSPRLTLSPTTPSMPQEDLLSTRLHPGPNPNSDPKRACSRPISTTPQLTEVRVLIGI